MPFLVKPIAGCPADDAPGEQVHDDGEVEPGLVVPHVGDVGATLVRPGRCEVLVQKVRGDRKGVKLSVARLDRRFCRALSPFSRISRATRCGRREPIVAKVVHDARAAVGPVREGEGRAA